MQAEERLIWTDVESFGLNPVSDPLLEVGFVITDLDLEPVQDLFHCLIWEPGLHDKRYEEARANPLDEYVLEMHTKNNLFVEAQAKGLSLLDAEEAMLEWCDANNIENGVEPLCGSSVDFDLKMLTMQFPYVSDRFHYRVINVSTLKELCKRYQPEMYAKMDVEARKLHRVLPDLEDTIAEYNWYMENFLILP